MAQFKVTIQRIAGKEPITGKFFSDAEETLKVESDSRQKAYFQAMRLTSLVIMGQDVKVFVDGSRCYPKG